MNQASAAEIPQTGQVQQEVQVSYIGLGVKLLTLNRPRVLNALTVEMLSAIKDELHSARREPQTRAVVLTGQGRAFSAGGDLRALEGMDADQNRAYMKTYAEVHRAIIDCDVPVIAAVNGYAFGGGLELACMADFRVVDPAAVLCVADAAVGMVPTGALTWALPRLVGTGKARMWTLLNTKISASESVESGLCEILSAPDDCVDHALRLADAMSAFPRHGLSAIRRTFAVAHTLEAAAETEVAENVLCHEHSETKAVIAEFTR